MVPLEQDSMDTWFPPVDKKNPKNDLIIILVPFKGTVSVILSDPPCKNGNAWVTAVENSPSIDTEKGYSTASIEIRGAWVVPRE